MRASLSFPLFSVLFLFYLNSFSHAQLVPNMYCGLENCYDVLGVTRESTRSEISKIYRGLARKFHPDYMKSQGHTPEEIKVGTERFMVIATAYETLKDSQAKEDYDHYLDHPEQYYYNYYRYYRQTVQVDVRYVIVGTITVFSIFQYISWQTSYNTAITYMVQNSKYRTAAKEEAKARGLWVDKSAQRKKRRAMTREEIKLEEENLLRDIIEEKMDIRGGYSKPVYTDVLWFQILLLPYYLYKFVHFRVRWFYDYTVMKKELSDDDKIIMICHHLSIKHSLWDIQDEKMKLETVKRELWVKENAQEYKAEKEEEARLKMALDPKMKRYRRWLNKGGAGRMTFDENEYDYEY